MDKVKGYKTVAFFVLVLAVAIANLLGFGDFELSSEQAEWLAVVVPLVGLLLRKFTDTPIFKNSSG